MKSIAPKMVALMIAVGASGAACASVNLHGEAGSEFTNLSASFGAGEPGMTFNTQWRIVTMTATPLDWVWVITSTSGLS